MSEFHATAGDIKLQGATGPLSRYLSKCESSLRALEAAFGLDPLARMRLGLSLLSGAKAVREAVAIEEDDPRELFRVTSK